LTICTGMGQARPARQWASSSDEIFSETPSPRDDHAAYIATWLDALKNDKRAIFTAAAHAQRAADYLHSLQPSTELPEAA
jgi:antirestriction protein ArdC